MKEGGSSSFAVDSDMNVGKLLATTNRTIKKNKALLPDIPRKRKSFKSNGLTHQLIEKASKKQSILNVGSFSRIEQEHTTNAIISTSKDCIERNNALLTHNDYDDHREEITVSHAEREEGLANINSSYNFVTTRHRKELIDNADTNMLISMTVNSIRQNLPVQQLNIQQKSPHDTSTNNSIKKISQKKARINKTDLFLPPKHKTGKPRQKSKLFQDSSNFLCSEDEFQVEETSASFIGITNMSNLQKGPAIEKDNRQIEGSDQRSEVNIEAESLGVEDSEEEEGTWSPHHIEDIAENVSHHSSTSILTKRLCFASDMDETSISERRELNDLGGPTSKCKDCGALFWYSERVGKGRHTSNPKYHKCCKGGKVKLPAMPPLPDILNRLMDYNGDELSKNYRTNIRLCNSMVSFTSSGANIDTSVNRTPGPFVYRINGQNNHLLGSLLPEEGKKPTFAQLYVYDTQNELDNRFAALNIDPSNSPVDRRIIEMLLEMLNDCNRLVRTFRMARDVYEREKPAELKLRLLSKRREDGAQYGNVEAPDLAGLIIGSEEEIINGPDIIVQYKTGLLQRIDSSFPTYMALQFPLLFPFGEDGYSDALFQVSQAKTARRITKCQYYCYRLHMRIDEAMTLLTAGRLTQQYAVDCFTSVEGDRLQYYRTHQDELRCELYCGVRDAVARGDNDAKHLGKRIILPSSFTAGPRYMAQNYQDAMAICRAYGSPDLFLTFTCNTKWKEIEEALKQVPGQKAEDRPDLAARVFKMKVDELMTYLNKKNYFGRMLAALYTIEFQKRGLPHAHILLWLREQDRHPTAAEIDKIISAKIPDCTVDPEGFEFFCQFMLHGPCGEARPNSPCMVDGKCSRHYPKNFNKETTIDQEGFPIYKRPDDGAFIMKNGIRLDNRHVIPHNLDLVIKFNAHINVEWCNKARSVKYLFKYINKGPDRVRAFIQYKPNGASETSTVQAESCDEIKTFVDCRYLSACEACWRLFEFPIHSRDPAVERLPFHLQDQQLITFGDADKVQHVLAKANKNLSKFLGWMKANEEIPEARRFTYAEFPTHFVWDKKKSIWKKRNRGKVIGRIYFTHPSSGEFFYLRMLLNVVKGCTSFEDIRTVDGITYSTYQEACNALGLLGDDKEWSETLKDASMWASAAHLRDLFVTILLFCEVGDPQKLWEENWKALSDDIIYHQRRMLCMPNLPLPEHHIKNLALFEIEKLLNQNCSSLEEFNMPKPTNSMLRDLKNRLVYEELSYVKDEQAELHEKLHKGLNEEQFTAYEKIMHSVNGREGKLFFVYGQGGTGKTHLWKTLLARMRAEGRIVLPVASSGIAALLLEGGRTAHSRFKIPIEIRHNSTCHVSQQSQVAALLLRTELIIWDEAPMDNKFCFEALNKTLQDIIGVVNPETATKPFGGLTVVLGGDFRQLLPVIVKGQRDEVVDSSINRSALWEHCEVIQLKKKHEIE